MTPDIARREAILDNVILGLRDLLPVDALAPNEKDQLVPTHNPDVCITQKLYYFAEIIAAKAKLLIAAICGAFFFCL